MEQMKPYVNVLAHCPLFFGIEEENLLKMLHCLGARVERFDKKYTVFSEGSPARYIGIVLSGSAQISQVDYYGNRSILSTVHRSDVFAEAFACAGVKELPVSVVANEPCEIMFIDCSHIMHTCHNNCGFHNQLIFNLMTDLARKTLLFHQRAEIIAKRTTREKLMTYLMYYSKQVKKNSFDIPFDRQELADFLEVDRSGLSAEISKLRAEGVLESKRKHFKLL